MFIAVANVVAYGDQIDLKVCFNDFGYSVKNHLEVRVNGIIGTVHN